MQIRSHRVAVKGHGLALLVAELALDEKEAKLFFWPLPLWGSALYVPASKGDARLKFLF